MFHIPSTPCIRLSSCLDQDYILVLREALIRKVPKIIKILSRQPKKRIHHVKQWRGVWAESSRSHKTVHEFICAFNLFKKTDNSETMEDIQKKTSAFKFSRPHSKTCSELSYLLIQPSHEQIQKEVKVSF